MKRSILAMFGALFACFLGATAHAQATDKWPNVAVIVHVFDYEKTTTDEVSKKQVDAAIAKPNFSGTMSKTLFDWEAAYPGLRYQGEAGPAKIRFSVGQTEGMVEGAKMVPPENDIQEVLIQKGMGGFIDTIFPTKSSSKVIRTVIVPPAGYEVVSHSVKAVDVDPDAREAHIMPADWKKIASRRISVIFMIKKKAI